MVIFVYELPLTVRDVGLIWSMSDTPSVNRTGLSPYPTDFVFRRGYAISGRSDSEKQAILLLVKAQYRTGI